MSSWQDNTAANLALLHAVQEAQARARMGGGPKYNDRHIKAGKLLPRERIELLLDFEAPFLELMPLAGFHEDSDNPGAGVVGGLGIVSGAMVCIIANESTVKGGAINRIGVQKCLRLADIATENRLPLIYLAESAGGDLSSQADVFVPGGQSFRDMTRRSKAKLTTISVVFGNSTAGGAYIPGMSDYAIFVDKQAKVFLAGPPLVKMATGEIAVDEELGGARMHATRSGVADYLAADEKDAISIARRIVSHLPSVTSTLLNAHEFKEPLYPADEILGIVSPDMRVPFDQREIIARIFDASAFDEFKPLYGETLVCGWARLSGVQVGILANNGVLFSESANKGAQFIELCSQQGTPLIFLQNITGFMVGKQYEQEGIIKNGAKLINAVSNTEVPILTVMTGASFGAGNYAMAGRAYAPRFVFSWPNHRIGIMGGEQLGGVMEIIKRESAQKRGETVDEDEIKMLKQLVAAQMDQESNALYATGRMWDDGIIDPRDTRQVLIIALLAALHQPGQKTNAFGVYRH